MPASPAACKHTTTQLDVLVAAEVKLQFVKDNTHMHASIFTNTAVNMPARVGCRCWR
jgi:hypothetical protein